MPKRYPLSIKGKIREAKKVLVFLDPDYRQSNKPLMVPVSRAFALKIVDIAGPDHEPTGVVDAEGILILHPAEQPS